MRPAGMRIAVLSHLRLCVGVLMSALILISSCAPAVSPSSGTETGADPPTASNPSTSTPGVPPPNEPSSNLVLAELSDSESPAPFVTWDREATIPFLCYVAGGGESRGIKLSWGSGIWRMAPYLFTKIPF